MKKVLFSLVCAMFAFGNAFAQDFTEMNGRMLKDSAEYAEVQPYVVNCCEFLLNSSVKNDEKNLIAFDFLVEWMNNNPYYSFQTHKKFFKIISDNAPLAARYFASMCKVAIDNNFSIKEEDLQYQAIDKFVRYCMYKKYHVEPDKRLQKYIDAKKDGKLQEML